MGQVRGAVRRQLVLFEYEPGDVEPVIPAAMAMEIVEVLAELLLEAAGAREGGRGVGADDESEDHT